MKIGDKVYYDNGHGRKENGIIKSFSDFDSNIAFVVYHCNNEWEDYKNYTGVGTKVSDLKEGWYDENIILNH